MRLFLAEFIGTFTLVFAGCAAIASGANLLGIALAFGLSVAVMIAAVGAISSAHFNPAVTVGFLVLGRITFRELLLYWSAELSGAIAALLALRGLVGTVRLNSAAYGATVLSPELTLWQGFGLELILTFFLMFVIAHCVLQQQGAAGLYIGLTVTLCALAAGPLTGASMNPARSFAPALFSGIWTAHWLYWLAPIVGAALAALAASYLWRNQAVLRAQSPALQQSAD
jgi:aquaporin Z